MLFSAFCNQDSYACPAALPYVFGVAEPKWKSSSGFLRNADIFIDGNIYLNDQYGCIKLSNCNSFACAEAVHLYALDSSMTHLNELLQKTIAIYNISHLKNTVVWSDRHNVIEKTDEVAIIVTEDEMNFFLCRKLWTVFIPFFAFCSYRFTYLQCWKQSAVN